MAGTSPRRSKDYVMDFVPPVGCKPIPPAVVRYTSQFDLKRMDSKRISKMMSDLDGGSFAERMEALHKLLESFKKPKPEGAYLVDEEDEEEEDEEGDEEEEDEEEEVMNDRNKSTSDVQVQDKDGLDMLICGEKKHASDVELQVRHEDERECKKPRFQESFEGQGEEMEAGEIKYSV